LRRLSHHTPSDSGVTKKRSRLSLSLVCSEIFQEVRNERNTGRRQSGDQAGPAALQGQTFNYAIQGVYVK
jgi:hypothetical protein